VFINNGVLEDDDAEDIEIEEHKNTIKYL